jgi:hypothetical protein
MARLAISHMTISRNLDESWLTSSVWDDESVADLKRDRLLKCHTGGLAKCSQCGTDVKIHVSPKRNPHSGKLGRIVTLKDHDLCRRCWRQIIRNCREAMLTYEWHVPALAEPREVA